MTCLQAGGMNVWLWSAAAVCACLIPCAAVCLRGRPERRLVGVQMTGFIVTIAAVLLTVGTGRPLLIDVPLTLAIMSYGGGLVYVRFLEKHL